MSLEYGSTVTIQKQRVTILQQLSKKQEPALLDGDSEKKDDVLCAWHHARRTPIASFSPLMSAPRRGLHIRVIYSEGQAKGS